MGIMVYSLLWVVQDFVHQPYARAFFCQLLFARRPRPTPSSGTQSNLGRTGLLLCKLELRVGLQVLGHKMQGRRVRGIEV